MIIIPGRIPIAIHPLFWVLALLIGWLNSGGTLAYTLIWVGVVFFSVLFHEYGHALTSLLFRQKARIQLVALGGLTSYEGPKLRFWQQFLIVFNGPLFGFCLFLLASWLLATSFAENALVRYTLRITQLANLFWTIVNLFPVLPLDGGHLLRIALESKWGVKGFRASLLFGAIFACVLSFGFFIVQFFLAGALFFLFAFQSFDLWRKSRIANRFDRDDALGKRLSEGELKLQEGKKEEAKEIFQEVCEKSHGGMMSVAAAQYLAILLMQENQHEKAYELLLPFAEHLSNESLCLLHTLSVEFQNDAMVAKLSSECYQAAPSEKMALANARAFARLKQAKLAGGWLQTAKQYGHLHLEEILREEWFHQLHSDPEFQEFFRK